MAEDSKRRDTLSSQIHPRLQEFNNWIASSVHFDPICQDDAAGEIQGDSSILAEQFSNGETVIVALPPGLLYLKAISAVMSRRARPVLAAGSLPFHRIEELTRLLGAGSAIFPKKRSCPAGVRRVELASASLVRFTNERSRVPNGDLVLLTSGTSGFSSGCVFSFDSLLRNAALHNESIGLTRKDTCLVVLPLSFSFAFVAQVLGSFLAGSELFVAPQPFSAKQFIEIVDRCEITATSLTPYLVKLILMSSQGFPSRLRVMTVGGDQLSRSQAEALLRARPGKELFLTYGLTEAGPRVTTLRAHAEPTSRWSSVGRPLPGITTWLENCWNGDAGLLRVRTPTAASVRIGIVDTPDGTHLANGTNVVQTGDIFRIDQDGYHYFLGRSSDFIIQSGEKLCLASIRRLAEGIRSVAKARTAVLSDGNGGDKYRLILYTDGAGSVTLEGGIREFLSRLRPSERPVSIDYQSISTYNFSK